VDTEKQRQRRCDNARLIESRNARSEQLLVVSTESLTNREIMAARRALEWIRTLKARLVFRYEISDLFIFVHVTFFFSSRCMFELKFSIYHREASLSSQVSSVDVCSIG